MGGNKSTRLQRALPLTARPLFWAWKQLRFNFVLQTRTADKLVLRLRQRPSTDLGIAREIFGAEIYSPPFGIEPADVRTIVDLGVNVGYGLLYFTSRFPQAFVHGFEPHPLHLDIARDHLRLNGVSERVRLHAYAAGRQQRTMHITDDGAGARVVDAPSANTHPVEMIDIFAFLKRLGPIDLLKVDIEGGEYDLLEDPRFGDLDVRVLVMEYHPNPQLPNARQHCFDRLKAAGYSVYERPDTAGGNMLWGTTAASRASRQ